ncbi:kelch-like protein diablo [Acropora millepora]|uniref:kelch-like protein diablo n=1 Tax=Acropora millepora TaxID=45264 RepID=UPI001CF1133B|nr:kelch-like protein diablo [Acropora millepora]
MADSGNKFSGVLKRSLSDTAEALLFTDENHGSTILKGLFASYKDGKYVDISLKIGPERTLRAHRAVLASFSPYFEARLGDNWKEGNKEEIEIPDLDEGAVSDLIEFAYTGKIKIDRDNALTLLEAANYLGIQTVKESCGNFLEQEVDDMVPCEEEREKTVLESVLQYVEHDVENRKTHLAQLLGLVRLPTLSAEYLAEVSRNKLLEESEFQDIMERAKNFKLHPPKKDFSVVIWAIPRRFDRIIYRFYFNRYHVVPDIHHSFRRAEIFKYMEPECHVTGMELWIRQWGGRSALGCLKAYYKGGKVMVFGEDCGGTYAETAQECHHEFHLEENERIVEAEIQWNWMIFALTFYTNKIGKNGKANSYGPIMVDGGSLLTQSAPESFDYLCGLSCTVVQSQGEAGITSFQLGRGSCVIYKDGQKTPQIFDVKSG